MKSGKPVRSWMMRGSLMLGVFVWLVLSVLLAELGASAVPVKIVAVLGLVMSGTGLVLAWREGIPSDDELPGNPAGQILGHRAHAPVSVHTVSRGRGSSQV